jgi:hypothetical protein
VPESFSVSGYSEDSYYLNPATSKFYWTDSTHPSEIKIRFRRFKYAFNSSYSNKSISSIQSEEGERQNPFLIKDINESNYAFTNASLEKSGNLSRGITLGNNQNSGVTSNLNLRLSGYIDENIRLNAVIADQSIPVQPNGNTQVIQDFDQVFIQIEHPNHRLTGGDFRIASKHNYFGKYD